MRIRSLVLTLAFLLVAGVPLASFAGPSDKDGDTVPDVSDNCPTQANAGQTNSDTDSHGDACDNCTVVANESQYDCDVDGYGNICDADFDQNGAAGASDFGLFKSNFTLSVPPGNPCTDMDGNFVTGASDFGTFKASFTLPPGPSGYSCATCTVGGCNSPCIVPLH